MTPFERLDACAVPFAESNIDTDQLAPGRFLRQPVGPRLLLHDRRFALDETVREDFVFNLPAYERASIVVAQQNFGIGSSREHAALALPAAGFRCVIAVSFGDIFYSNCLQVGVLPVVAEAKHVDDLLQLLRARPGMHVKVDLVEQTVQAAGWGPHRFAISAARKTSLLEGLDDLSLTDRYRADIVAFETRYYDAFPWLA